MVGCARSRDAESTYRCSRSVRVTHHSMLHPPYVELAVTAVGKVMIKASLCKAPDPIQSYIALTFADTNFFYVLTKLRQNWMPVLRSQPNLTEERVV